MENWRKNTIVVCLLFLGMAGATLAQSGVEQGEHEAIGDWKFDAKVFEKPQDEPTVIDNKVETKNLSYGEKQIKAETEYEPFKPTTPAPPKVPMDDLKNNLVKLSFGRFASPYAKIWLNSGRNVNSKLSFDFSHASSSKGYLDYAEWRDDEGGIKGEYYTKTNTMRGSFRLQNSNYFYFADTLPRINPEFKDSIRNTFTRLDAEVGIARNYDPKEVMYDVGLRFQGYFDRWDDKDLHISLSPKANWKVTDDVIADVYSNFVFSNSSFDSLQQSRFFLDITPTINLRMDKFLLAGGIKINSFTDSTSKFKASPILKASYQVVPDKFLLSAGFLGEMHYLKYYDLVTQNRYINRMPDIRPSRDAYKIYVGAGGNLAKYLNFNATIYTKKVKDQLIYFNPEGQAYFQMLYDSNFTQSGLELSLAFNKNDNIRAGITGDFRSFKTSNIDYNFNMPGTKVDIWASYNFANKVFVATEVYLFGPRVMSMDSLGAAIEQGITADVNLSAEYRFNKRFSVFLELNNLLDNRWQRWYNYQERPFDVKGGLTFSF